MTRIEQLPLFEDIVGFVDNVMPHIETLAEAKVLIYICEYARFTPTHITVDEFVKVTALSESSILRGLKSAQDHGLITVTVDETDKSYIKKYYCLRRAHSATPVTIRTRTEKQPEEVKSIKGLIS